MFPECLRKASQSIVFYSIRSDRMCCELLYCSILFRWCPDKNLDQSRLDQSNFSRLRERLI